MVILLIVATYSLLSFVWGVKNKNRPFGLSKFFNPIGSFVWIDNVVFGLFFFVVSVFCLLTNQLILFWLIFAIFWLVRSIGEWLYWFLEQFAIEHRNPPHTLWPSRWFRGQETWVIMQIFWQCVTVVMFVVSIFLTVIWVKNIY